MVNGYLSSTGDPGLKKSHIQMKDPELFPLSHTSSLDGLSSIALSQQHREYLNGDINRKITLSFPKANLFPIAVWTNIFAREDPQNHDEAMQQRLHVAKRSLPLLT